MVRYLKLITIVIIILLPTFLLISLHKSKCSIANFFQVKKDISLEYAFLSCKFLYKSYLYETSKKFILNSPFEYTLRKNREKKYGIKYPILKKEYFDTENISIRNQDLNNIVGLKNSKLEKYLVSDVKYKNDETKTWLRSHGGYKNLKFNNSKSNINLNNIKKLKLKWKYQTFDYKKSPNKWRLNSEVNPVFIDNKIIFVSADFQIVALNAQNGNLIWKKQFLLLQREEG